MSRNSLRGVRHPIVAEALESRALFSVAVPFSPTPVFLHSVISTGRVEKFHSRLPDGVPFTVQVKNGTADVFQVDNRLQLSVTGTDVDSTVIVIGKLELANVNVAGSLNVFQASKSNLSGVMFVSGLVNKLVLQSVSGTFSATGDLGNVKLGGVTGVVAAGGFVDKISIGTLNNAKVLSGIFLGVDEKLGGNDDTYSSGAINTMRLTGPLINSVVAVGANPGLDGVFGTADDVRAGGGVLDKLTVVNGADATSRFEAGGFGTVKISPFGTLQRPTKLEDPLLDPHFKAI